ncbi:MAG: hypothetical protein AB8I08_30035 [Sandaracinaceae bacterium]
MRIGLLGPAQPTDRDALRDGIEFLLGDVEVERVLYLGADPTVLHEELASWGQELGAEAAHGPELARRASELAANGSPEDIDDLLARNHWHGLLARVHTLPAPPARAVEMITDRIMLGVYDKSVLDEEDIANAHLIVYGRAGEAGLKRFGRRYFLTPGPIGASRVAVVDVEDDGQISLVLFETSGVPVWRENMARGTSKMSVAR